MEMTKAEKMYPLQWLKYVQDDIMSTKHNNIRDLYTQYSKNQHVVGRVDTVLWSSFHIVELFWRMLV